MIANDTNRDQLCLAFRLGLERCQQNLAHLHALIYMGGLPDADEVLSSALVAVLANLEKELTAGHGWLEQMVAG